MVVMKCQECGSTTSSFNLFLCDACRVQMQDIGKRAQDVLDMEGFTDLFENLPDMNTRTKITNSGVQIEGAEPATWPLPTLRKSWCDCGVMETFGCYPEDGECVCGTNKHHVHCGTCGKISQIG